MDKWFKDILPDKDPYHNRGRDQMRKKGDRNSNACVMEYKQRLLVQNMHNVFEWSHMSTYGLLFHWISTIKIQLSVLILYKVDLIMSSECNLFASWLSEQIIHLTLNNNHPVLIHLFFLLSLNWSLRRNTCHAKPLKFSLGDMLALLKIYRICWYNQ
jgi:hypothetical protein